MAESGKDGFSYVFRPGAGPGAECLLLLHGTGGSEHDLLGLGSELAPGRALLSPRGRVSENGHARFFRRFGEGNLDVEDWKRRTEELADFVVAKGKEHGFDPGEVTALGYSNGANIALGLLLLRPDALGRAILLRPMFVSGDVRPVDLTGKVVCLLAGRRDPLISPEDGDRLRDHLESCGATVELHRLEAGHGLIAEDFEVIRRWLGVESGGG